MFNWMAGVALSLSPLLLVATYAYGLGVLLVVSGTIAGSLVADFLMKFAVGNRQHLDNGSGVVSGILISLVLPPAIGVAAAFVAGLAGTLLARELFGGLGRNLLHEAAVAHLFMRITFPDRMLNSYLQPFWWKGTTGFSGTWRFPEGVDAALTGHLQTEFATARGALREVMEQSGVVSSMTGALDRVSELGQLHQVINRVPQDIFWISNAGGLIGSVSIAALLLAFILLANRRIINWDLPFTGLLLFLGVYGLLDSLHRGPVHGSAFFYLGVAEFWLVFGLLGTDPVTSPLTRIGRFWAGGLMGIAAGVLVYFLPPAASPFILALLIMNLITPLLNAVFLPGGRRVP